MWVTIVAGTTDASVREAATLLGGNRGTEKGGEVDTGGLGA